MSARGKVKLGDGPGNASTASSYSGRGDHGLPPLLPNDSRDVVDARLSGETQTNADGATPIYESPTTFSTQSARSPSRTSTLRTRKRTTLPAAAPRSTQSIEPQIERPKKYIADKTISKALQRSILHILPVLVTSVLVALNAREVYMSDLNGFSGQDVVLQAFQFVVKAHEILMTMSIGDIVLHRIRWDLIAVAGVPFGLLSAAYQLGDIAYLFSTEFRSSVWRPSSHDPSFSRLTLSLLVAVSCILCLVVGPSSGVLLIPQLSWWPLKRPFGSTTLRVFNSNGTQEMYWPNPLPYYGCGASWLCPGFAAGTITTWASSLMFTDASGQIPFIDGGDNFYRWLISNATDYGGWTASTSPMMTMSTLIGAYWNWISYQALMPTASLKQPQLSLAFVDNGPVLQPLVQVQCSAHSSNGTQTDLKFPNDQLKTGVENAYGNITWPVLSNYSEVDLFQYSTSNLFVARPPLEGFDMAPSALFVFALTNQNYTKTVIPCSILAHWVPSELSVYPKTDRNIHDTFSNPIDIFDSSNVDLSQSNQLTISEDWWAMLNDDDATPLSDILQAISLGAADGYLKEYVGGAQGLAYRFSTMVGMFVTDAIARYYPGTDHVVYQDSRNGSEPYAQNLGYFYQPHEPVPKGYWSWLAYADAKSNEWREATFTVRRYGYAWSFGGVLSKFAGIALLIHSLLALAHVAIVLHGRWTSSAWSSIGNMIALALRSRSPAVPTDHWTGGEKKETWAETVSVRVIEDELELMFNPTRAETLRLIQR